MTTQCTVCERPSSEFPMVFRGRDECSDACEKRAKEKKAEAEAGSGSPA